MPIYGYCRCSTKTQRINRQIEDIKKYCKENNLEEPLVYYKDKWTGRTLDRPSWNLLMRRIKAGDTIIFESVSRMSRNREDGYNEYFRLYEEGVNLIFVKERHINTESYKQAMNTPDFDASDLIDSIQGEHNKAFVKAILEAMNNWMKSKVRVDIYDAFKESEKEIQVLSQRTKEGMAVAAALGHHPGRKKGQKVETKKAREAKEFIRKNNRDFEGTLNDRDTLDLYLGRGNSISRASFYLYKSQLIKEQGPQVSRG